MAAIAAGGGLGLGQIQLQTLKPNTQTSPFLGKKLMTKKPFDSPHNRKRESGLSPKKSVVTALGGELISLASDLFVGVGVGLPCTVMECGDIIYRSTLPRSDGLTITAPGAILAFGALSYLWATPGVAPGFWDMFVLAFVERIFRTTYKKVSKLLVVFVYLFYFVGINLFLNYWIGCVWQDDFVLGRKLGEGAFGVVYRVSLAKKPGKKVLYLLF